MSNLVDLWSESNPSLISDDATAALTLSNTTATGVGLKVNRLAGGSASVALIQVGVSGASVPVFQLQANSFVSAVSLIFAASANWAGMGAIRVQLSDATKYGWIPVLPDGQVTAAAI